MNCKAVLFDMDGVLIDSESYYCKGTYTWMKELGYKGKVEPIYAMLGTTMDATYEILANLLENRYSIAEITEMNEGYFLSHPLPYEEILKPGVRELLEKLKTEGKKIAVCSSSAQDLIDIALQRCQILEWFDFIVSGEQFNESKPHPEIYLHAAEALKVSVDECVVIEDSKYGILAGKNAGMKVIALHDPQFNIDQSLADIRVDSMTEVGKQIDLLG